MVHLVPIKTTTKALELAWLYVEQVVRLHGLPKSIVSDRDPKFTSKFWREVHRILGTKLKMSTAFHPQTDGASERSIRSVTQILRAMVRPDQMDWTDKVPLTEFAINSAVSSSTGFAPFELNYGYLPSMNTQVQLDSSSAPRGIKAFVDNAVNSLAQAHDAIITSRVNQAHHANKRRRMEMPMKVGDWAYLATENLNLPKGRARKLMPKFVGPYRIAESNPETSNYVLELPEELRKRGIHPKFHVSRLRPHVQNDDVLFPHREVKVFYDFGLDENDEWLVDIITGHRWDKGQIEFEVRWNLGDTTWEPYQNVKELQALDEYLETHGVKSWRSLPRCARK